MAPVAYGLLPALAMELQAGPFRASQVARNQDIFHREYVYTERATSLFALASDDFRNRLRVSIEKGYGLAPRCGLDDLSGNRGIEMLGHAGRV